MRGKLIVVEGTDCSGKETQTNMMIDKLKDKGYDVYKFSFPAYDTPTGKIVGGPYLGKNYICDGWFSEGAINVDPKVASLYYAADRRYNINKIIDMLNKGTIVVLDRYVYSNMAHQGGKLEDEKERFAMYDWLDNLEFKSLELPEADIKIFLHMPYEWSMKLGHDRTEALDQHEASPDHLRHAEKAYLEVAKKYNFHTIECVDNDIKTREAINEEIMKYLDSLK